MIITMMIAMVINTLEETAPMIMYRFAFSEGSFCASVVLGEKWVVVESITVVDVESIVELDVGVVIYGKLTELHRRFTEKVNLNHSSMFLQ